MIRYTLMGRNITEMLPTKNCEYHFINGIKTGLVTCSHNLVQHSWLQTRWHDLNFTAHGITKNPQDYPILLVTQITLCKLYHGWGSHYHLEALQWRHDLLPDMLLTVLFCLSGWCWIPQTTWKMRIFLLCTASHDEMELLFFSSFPCLSTNTIIPVFLYICSFLPFLLVSPLYKGSLGHESAQRQWIMLVTA